MDIPAPWSRPKWTVAGRTVTLDQIEHQFLRRDFREPRIHFALVCASRSCPALRIYPYRAEFLDAQLDSAAREFVLDRSRNDFTPRGGAIRISKIFDWYGKDFVGVYSDSTFARLYGREMGAVLAYVSRFLPAETVAALRAKRSRVTYLPYDWSLNIAPARLDQRDGAMLYTNHSCDPNIAIQGQIVFVAMRDIAPGEELTHDWATTDDGDYEIECNCACSGCRRTVTGRDWMKPEVQEKYRGWFCWFLQRKIDALTAGTTASVGGTVGGVVDGGAASSGADRLGSSAAWTMIRFLAE